ncbi:quinone oxidoreductase, putative [Ixodes scapularis]|uniref:Quinone oxidoreductase, putative n=1 Tax=Ixodes scapularis TaxID=6945 RepID=B7Q5K2_IXOSC|nr:quinone oxidoreductase, putative [Ixodes scapularis]|eukprot:XP_002411785.1 quinone oxidoreductase, putative [Ixodes scapularis]
MKAIFKEVVEGQRTQILVEHDVGVPPVDKYSVLINVKACAISRTDDKLLYKEKSKTKYPVCYEIAGVVVEVGDWVMSVNPGDGVVGLIPLDYDQSGCADYVCLNEYDIAKKPDNVSFVDAAGCIGDAVRAYTGLHYLGRMTSGDTVLVMDGASSFGAIAVQLAHHWGAKVITTVSSADEALYLEGLRGQVAKVIDLSKTDNSTDFITNYTTGGLGVDLVFDNGVTQFAETSYHIIPEETYSHPVPSKHDIVSCLAVGGRWITSKSDLQLDPPHSQMMFMKCASLGFLFEHAWTLSSTQQGRYLHILMDIMEKVSSGVIRYAINIAR